MKESFIGQSGRWIDLLVARWLLARVFYLGWKHFRPLTQNRRDLLCRDLVHAANHFHYSRIPQLAAETHGLVRYGRTTGQHSLAG
jgi:hypothetical protein